MKKSLIPAVPRWKRRAIKLVSASWGGARQCKKYFPAAANHILTVKAVLTLSDVCTVEAPLSTLPLSSPLW